MEGGGGGEESVDGGVEVDVEVDVKVDVEVKVDVNVELGVDADVIVDLNLNVNAIAFAAPFRPSTPARLSPVPRSGTVRATAHPSHSRCRPPIVAALRDVEGPGKKARTLGEESVGSGAMR